MRRLLAVSASVALAGAAAAQAPNLFREHFAEMVRRGMIQAAPPSPPSPLEPSGQPQSTPAAPELPSAAQDRIRIIHADSIDSEGDDVELRGNVHIQFRGYDLFADRIVGNTRTQVFTLMGGATATGQDADLKGETVTIDFLGETYVADDVRGVLQPSMLGGQTQGPLYIRGDRIQGARRGEIHSHDGGVTTCDLAHPHYELDGRMITIRPEKRMILRDARLRILGKTVLRIPYIVIPLDTRRNEYTPEVGRTRDQGYYIKTFWGIDVAGPHDATGYVDYFEKLGWGLGARFRYTGRDMTGFLRAYTLTGDQQTREATLGHRQMFGSHVFQIESNYQQRNYLNAPQNTIWQTRGSFTFNDALGTSRLAFTRYSNESPTFSNVQESLSVSDQRRFTPRTRWSIDVAWARSRSQFSSNPTVSREQVDVRMRGFHDMRKLVAELEYQRSIPVGQTNFFSSGDRTPVLSLRTDGNRLFGPEVGRRWPIATELSVGEFVNPSNRRHITRTYFDVSFNRPENISARQGFGINARFRQGFYSDDTAQYALALNTTYRYNLGPDTSFNVRYNYLEPKGFTPLSIDRLGRINFASADVSVRPAPNLLLGAQSSYDFNYRENNLTTPWQQIALRSEWRPWTHFLARGLSVYDPASKIWSNTRIDLTYERGDVYVGLGARYDGVRETWGQINLFADGLRYKRWSGSVLLAYNGYTRRFDSRQFSLIYDMHCTEAVLQVIENNVGFRSGREIYFFIRIKALPFNSRFGTGTFGQPFGTGTGFGF